MNSKATNLTPGYKSSFKSIILSSLILTAILFTLLNPQKPVVAKASSGNTYYVSTTGSDANPGSQALPWLTIQKAANTVTAGDTVNVIAGDYSTQRVLVTTSGSSGLPITFQAQGSVTMKGFTVKANYVDIIGFYITNTDDDDTNGWGIFYEGSNCLIEGNYVYYATRGGIILYTSPTNFTETANCVVSNNKLNRNSQMGIEVHGRNNLIEYNEVWGSIQYHPSWINPPSWVDADGMRFFGQGHVFIGNYIHDIDYGIPENVNPHIDCFQTFGNADDEAANNILFEGNFCSVKTYQAVLEKGSAFTIENGTNITIRNNILEAFLVIYVSNGSNITVENNLINGNLSFPDDLNPGGINFSNSPNGIVLNNVFYNEPGYTLWAGDTTSQQGLNAGNNWVYRDDGQSASGIPYPKDVFNVNPELVDPANNNFHLLSNSPLIGAGVPIPGLTTDYDSVTRPQGTGIAIGPFEYVGTRTSTPTTVSTTQVFTPTGTNTLIPASPTTASSTATGTPVTPTATKQVTSTYTPAATKTAVSTATPTLTNTPIPSTATSTKVPTSTTTSTSIPASPTTAPSTPTNTPVSPTITQTNSLPSPTPTNTQLPSAIITNTPLPSSTATAFTPTSVTTATSLPTQCSNCSLADSPWPMAGDNFSRNARSSYTGSANPVIQWSLSNGSTSGTNPILDINNNIYIGAGPSIEEISPTGNVLWSLKTGGTVTSPVLTAAGTLYFGSADGNVYSVSSLNGQIFWTYLTKGAILASPGIGSDGALFIPSSDGVLYALKSDGSLSWSFTSGSSINSSPTILGDGSICFGTSSGWVYDLSSEGKLNWSYLTDSSITSAPAIGSNDTIYIGVTSGRIYAISSSGSLIWSYLTGGSLSAPAIDNEGNIYFGSADNHLYAFSSSGAMEWSYQLGGEVGSPIIGHDGIIYVGSQDGFLSAFQNNGNLTWTLYLGGTSSINPVIGSDGSFYTDSGGIVHAVVDSSDITPNPPIKYWKSYLPAILGPIQ